MNWSKSKFCLHLVSWFSGLIPNNVLGLFCHEANMGFSILAVISAGYFMLVCVLIKKKIIIIFIIIIIIIIIFNIIRKYY